MLLLCPPVIRIAPHPLHASMVEVCPPVSYQNTRILLAELQWVDRVHTVLTWLCLCGGEIWFLSIKGFLAKSRLCQDSYFHPVLSCDIFSAFQQSVLCTWLFLSIVFFCTEHLA